MNCKIPFTKDIDFEKKVSEITSISLEHDFKVEGLTLNGNFIVSGDFKSHEVSVNKEPFSYVLPFEIDLTEDIDSETVEFMIDDFTYEIVDSSILKVNIDFNVIAAKKEVEEVQEEEPLFQDPNIAFEEERQEVIEEPIVREEAIETKKEVLTKESEDTIINSIKSDKGEYATYHIHMVNDGETIETVCTMYNSNLSILGDYNDLSNVTVGDKIIVPEIDE